MHVNFTIEYGVPDKGGVVDNVAVGSVSCITTAP